jgi:hypothetical protein
MVIGCNSNDRRQFFGLVESKTGSQPQIQLRPAQGNTNVSPSGNSFTSTNNIPNSFDLMSVSLTFNRPTVRITQPFPGGVGCMTDQSYWNNNRNVSYESCTGTSAQEWDVQSPGWGLNLVSVNSGRCADVELASASTGANVLQWDCGTQSNQKWILEPTPNTPYFRLRATHSGKCLDVYGGSTADGANVQQWDCHTGDNQQWLFREVQVGGPYEIVNKLSGKCLDVYGGSTANAANIHQWSCLGGANQHWSATGIAKLSIRLVEIARSNGLDPRLQNDANVSLHVSNANAIFAPYGIELSYSPSKKVRFNSDTLFSIGSPPVPGPFTCPVGFPTATPEACAAQLADFYAPDLLVLTSSFGGGFSSGDNRVLAIGEMKGPASTFCQNSAVQDTWFLAHELGHYFGLQHPFDVPIGSDTDLLEDTATVSISPAPPPECLNPTGPVALWPATNGVLVNTNNVMSISNFRHQAYTLTPMQRAIVRHGLFARGY